MEKLSNSRQYQFGIYSPTELNQLKQIKPKLFGDYKASAEKAVEYNAVIEEIERLLSRNIVDIDFLETFIVHVQHNTNNTKTRNAQLGGTNKSKFS